MTGQQFINQLKAKWLGKYVDYDGVMGYQCTDFVKEGLTEATGRRFGTMGNAIDWWNRPVEALIDVATSVRGSNAVAGDIVIKRPNHVAFATGNITGSQLEILEQDGHTGTGTKSPGNEVRTRWINRSDVAGLWRIYALHLAAPASSSVVGKHITLPTDSGAWHLYHESGPYTVASGKWITILHPSPANGAYTYPIVADKGNGVYVINSPRWGRGALYTKGSKFVIK